jgi:hypothetical protein
MAEPTLERVTLTLCSLCLDGKGGECHTPGCALWINRAPDLELRSKVEAAPAQQEETGTRELLARALRWIRDYGSRDGDLRDPEQWSEGMRNIATNALAAASLPSRGGERACDATGAPLCFQCGRPQREHPNGEECAVAPPSGEPGPVGPASVLDLFIERLTLRSPSFWHTAEMSSAPERLWNKEGEQHWLDGRDATIRRAREDFDGALVAARADVLANTFSAPPAGETGDGREPREWTLHRTRPADPSAAYTRIDGPNLERGEKVRVREIPSEETER